jgi:hypothetical protein
MRMLGCSCNKPGIPKVAHRHDSLREGKIDGKLLSAKEQRP